ncbi:2-oxo acid dehydrogenase subunit E2 [Catalinimonas niigatensis]|uniref:2-oxo acid dehydrogenase subunit E2 n=1 Tax=Catalinimonas niigatensis TaxID=1397264 RepID=UPI002665C135|nr:2-oxo acid dehydrogenase subunit E2 [Catalinimonas niigatensis]WPP48661.1 2-oxo acid dehydrogenase subunit E2 [Catalinimonas niigatensis]
MAEYKIQQFPKGRIATIDVFTMGLKKHHVAALIEVDVTESRAKIRQYQGKISFTAWLIKVISHTLKDYEQATAYLKGKRKLILFKDINVSIIVEKDLNGHKVPVPLIIEKANERSVGSISEQIKAAREKNLTDEDIVLHKKSGRMEQFYYILPGFIRRLFWQYLLAHPQFAYRKMGNVSITSVGMMGNVNGWFIPSSVHPLAFGIGSIIKKPSVVNDKIEIREILNMTVLLDHDVMDGAPMARFISKLSDHIEQGTAL